MKSSAKCDQGQEEMGSSYKCLAGGALEDFSCEQSGQDATYLSMSFCHPDHQYLRERSQTVAPTLR